MRDNLLASLPGSRKAEALKLFAELESKNDEVLERRRGALFSLSTRAEATRIQVLKRLQILDDQHAFVRTHLFWVRDGQPMGMNTVEQFRREGHALARNLVDIASETWSPTRWGRVSWEFVAVAITLAAMPYLLHRLRKSLRAALDRERRSSAVAA
jgi:potassium efflux system protein